MVKAVEEPGDIVTARGKEIMSLLAPGSVDGDNEYSALLYVLSLCALYVSEVEPTQERVRVLIDAVHEIVESVLDGFEEEEMKSPLES